jgi:hypothetical protein
METLSVIAAGVLSLLLSVECTKLARANRRIEYLNQRLGCVERERDDLLKSVLRLQRWSEQKGGDA